MDHSCILVTGASGFVGRELIKHLQTIGGYKIRVALRAEPPESFGCVEPFLVESLSKYNDWVEAVNGVDVIVHLAGRVHVINEHAVDPLAEFRSVNVEATKNLAIQAAASGVKRFIFISTVGVHGAETAPGEKFSESSAIKPYNNYSLSKWEAEQELLAVAATTKMEVVIVRPPLVYGGQATGNFGRLLNVLDRTLPLPLASVCNLRSFVGIGNLVEFIVKTIHHPAAANQIFIVSDGDDISTVGLLGLVGIAMGKRVRLFSVPTFILKLCSYVIGRSSVYRQLVCNLQVDSSKARVQLEWTPRISTKDGLQEAAYVFIKNKKDILYNH